MVTYVYIQLAYFPLTHPIIKTCLLVSNTCRFETNITDFTTHVFSECVLKFEVFKTDRTQVDPMLAPWTLLSGLHLDSIWMYNTITTKQRTAISSTYLVLHTAKMSSTPARFRDHAQLTMMTSSNWSHFRVTGPLRGKPLLTGQFASQRPVRRGYGVFVYAPE